MNLVKKQIIILLLNAYKRKFKFLKLRKLIKKLIGNERIISSYQNIKIVAGTQSAIESSILFDEYNEKAILNLITYFSTLNYDFVDVGANVGVHSLTAAMANKDIKVFSFEPEPINFFNFISNISLNRVLNIKPFNFGVGNKQEEKSLNINAGWNKGRHSLKMNFGENTQKINIPIITLDAFETYFSAKDVMIKIDVEGFEKEVLEGAKMILNKLDSCILIIELLEENNGESRCEEITSLLQNLDFKIIYKIQNENEFLEVNKYHGSSDYLFIKDIQTLKYFKEYLVV